MGPPPAEVFGSAKWNSILDVEGSKSTSESESESRSNVGSGRFSLASPEQGGIEVVQAPVLGPANDHVIEERDRRDPSASGELPSEGPIRDARRGTPEGVLGGEDLRRRLRVERIGLRETPV
jgi:hypothetical protein